MSPVHRRIVAAAVAAFLLSCLYPPIRYAPHETPHERVEVWSPDLGSFYPVDWSMLGLRAVVLAGAAAVACLLTGAGRPGSAA